MARRPQLPFHDVRTLSLREIVLEWRKEVEIPQLVLARELRRFVLNHDLNWQEGERIDPETQDDKLPPLTTQVDKAWLETFCRKKNWPLPSFWFPPDPTEAARPGRPSIKSATVQEFEERAGRGETEETISAEARAIVDALRQREFDSLPQLKTIQNHIRTAYNAWKNAR